MNQPNITSLDFMDSVPLNTLLRHVLPYVPKLPQAMALDMVRQKYIDFARRTRILCCEITKNYQAGVRDYYLEAPKDHSIYSIVGIDTGGFSNWMTLGSPWALGKSFDVVDNNCIKLRNEPAVDREGGLKVYVTLLPQACINYMPASLILPFGKQIADGVVGDALCIPNKEWTNHGLSRKYELNYERMLLSARALSSSNRKVDSTAMKPVRIL